jgi:hypothetical protein
LQISLSEIEKKLPHSSLKKTIKSSRSVMKNRVLSDTEFRGMKIRRNQAGAGANESHFINKKLTPELTP